MSEPVDADAEPLAWGIAANVNPPGTRFFAPGAKVWITYLTGGQHLMRVVVAGHHRGRGHRLVKMISNTKHFSSFRARGIYSPGVFNLIENEWPGHHWKSREEAEEYAAAYNRYVEGE